MPLAHVVQPHNRAHGCPKPRRRWTFFVRTSFSAPLFSVSLAPHASAPSPRRSPCRRPLPSSGSRSAPRFHVDGTNPPSPILPHRAQNGDDLFLAVSCTFHSVFVSWGSKIIIACPIVGCCVGDTTHAQWMESHRQRASR